MWSQALDGAERSPRSPQPVPVAAHAAGDDDEPALAAWASSRTLAQVPGDGVSPQPADATDDGLDGGGPEPGDGGAGDGQPPPPQPPGAPETQGEPTDAEQAEQVEEASSGGQPAASGGANWWVVGGGLLVAVGLVLVALSRRRPASRRGRHLQPDQDGDGQPFLEPVPPSDEAGLEEALERLSTSSGPASPGSINWDSDPGRGERG